MPASAPPAVKPGAPIITTVPGGAASNPSRPSRDPRPQIFARRSRRELETTETELKAMASEAMTGLSSTPKKG